MTDLEGNEVEQSGEWIDELEAAISKLYNVIPRMAELGEDEAWLEDAVHSRNQLEMIAREKRSQREIHLTAPNALV